MSSLPERPSKKFRHSDVEIQDVEMQEGEEMQEAEEMQEDVEMQSFDVSSDVNCNYWTYDSKEFTGYVGLKKEGLTCYMNSFLQSLYHIPALRKAVYNISTHDDKLPSSTPLALQSLFCKLQCDNSSVGTKDFPKSFGWDIYDSFMQNNAFNLNTLLFQKLQEKMKRTSSEDTAIDHLFRGHYNGIDGRKPFYALQLDVEGCKDVYASFDKYGEKERVKGDNKNVSKQHVLQDATNGVFLDLPPILLLHLNRFKFESGGETMLKINDSYEFPPELNLDKYLSLDNKRGDPYVLHSVLVHSGGVHGGHYYAYIRPTLSNVWYKFDDEIVTQEQSKTAIEDQYGVHEGSSQTHEERNGLFKYTNYSNAHMLVYIRKSKKKEIICDIDENDVADVKTRLLEKDGEADENEEKKFKAGGGLYIKVFRDEDLHKQIGKDQCFDLVDHNKDKTFTCFKHNKPDLLRDLKNTIMDILKVPFQSQRLWICEETPNHTYHPSRLLTAPDETQLGKLIDVSKKNHTLYLFLKEDTTLDLGHRSPLARSREHILVFIKFYESEKTEPQNLGSHIVKRSDIVIEFIRDLIMKAKLNIDDEIELYQEMPFKSCLKCEHLGKEDTFAEIQDGDIIWFQKSGKADLYPDVPSYLEYKENVQFVNFRPLTDGDTLELELSKQHIYDNVVQQVAMKLGKDSSLIELTSYNHYLDGPNSHPIKPQAGRCLMDMLVHYNEVSNILYYKVLAEPLPQKDSKKDLKVSYYNPPNKEALDIKLDKNSTVADLLDVIKNKVKRLPRGAKLRLLDVYHHRINKIFEPNQKIGSINDDGLRAEIIRDEEENITPPDRLVHVYYFTMVEDQMRYSGDPFLLKISELDKLKDVKDCIVKKLKLTRPLRTHLSKCRFSVVSLRQLELPEYIEHDDEIVLPYFVSTTLDAYGGWAQHLGIQLPADAPANQ